MTKNRVKTQDRENTLTLLIAIANGQGVKTGIPNWLGHTEGAAEIDVQLLFGTTMDQMELCRSAVTDHLRHLHDEHGLTIEARNGVYRMIVPPEIPQE